jgi:DnaK suppressor protein
VTGYDPPMDDEELTGAQIEELRGELGALKEALERALDGSKEGAQVVSLDQPIGRVSRIDAIQQQKMAEASRRQQELRLGQVKIALGAVERGDYGYCRSCEEPIAYRRLAARPETPFCLRCQGGRER